MSNQPENEIQHFEAMTEIEASSNVMEELSDESLEEVTGGVIGVVYVAPAINWAKKAAPVVMDKMSSYGKFFK